MAKKTKPKARAKAARPVKKVPKKTVKKAKPPVLECGVCAYRVIVDQSCGCAEEHVLFCCGEAMTKA